MPATIVVPLRFPTEFIARLREQADADGSSLNGLVRRTLSTALGIPDEPLPRGLAGASQSTRTRVNRAGAKARGVKLGKAKKIRKISAQRKA